MVKHKSTDVDSSVCDKCGAAVGEPALRAGALFAIARPDDAAPNTTTAKIRRRAHPLPNVKRESLRKNPVATGVGASGLNGLIEHHRDGIVLLGRDGGVLYANAAVRLIAARNDALTIGKTVAALRPCDNAALQGMIAKAASQGEGGDPLRLPRKFGGLDYVVTVSPLSQGTGTFSPGTAVALLHIVDPDGRHLSEEQMIKLFALSPAQARLALKLLEGLTLEKSAVSLGVAVPTARTHLAEIFRKTRTARQTELIRLLVAIG